MTTYRAEPQDPNEDLDYFIGITEELVDGESVADVEIVSTVPDGLTIHTEEQVNDTIQFWARGGTHRVDYEVTARFTTDSTPPRKYDRTLVIPIREK
ncbi:hypothetical protein [Euryhalocaulis caribicus]|uniref:phage fiber-tail adaptor protein n=1 Tax=Euryhalocaulis caribicus TaxID=1161401 RepID=UPI0003A699F4|nr:hypothetical protein [Euryhalocaulis caribicus]